MGLPRPEITKEQMYNRRAKGYFYNRPEWWKLSKWIKRQHYRKYGYKCLCCKGKMPPSKFVTDHIIPLSFRPELALDTTNLQVICQKCNSNKRGLVRDYRPEDYFTRTPIDPLLQKQIIESRGYKRKRRPF